MSIHTSPRGTAHAAAGDAGFTLIEILIATVIMLVISMGVITALSFSGWATSLTGQRTKALNLANQYIERARNLPYDQIGTYVDGPVYGDPPGAMHTPDVVGDFTVTTVITWQRDATSHRAKYKNVAVTVNWSRPIVGTVKLSTSIFGQSDLVNTGDLEINFVDHDTNAPIPGLAVTVVPAGSTQPRTVSTDTSGTAFFGMMPTGTAAMTISTSAWVFDTTVSGDVPIINVATGDVLSSYTVKGQKPQSLRVRAIGTHGDGLANTSLTTTVMGAVRTATTDSSGYATFTMLPHATYSVTATRFDRETLTSSFVVPTPAATTQPIDVTMTLHDPAQIKFRVTGANVNDRKDGATVTVYTQAGVAVSSGTTAGGGYVVLPAIVAGNYFARAVLGTAQGRYPSTTTLFFTVSTSDYGNDLTPLGYLSDGYLIQIFEPGIIRVNVTKTGGGVFPFDVPINVDGTLHNSVGGTWDFLVPDLRTYSVSATYAGHRPFSTTVVISSYGQVVPVNALLDDTSDMTVQVLTKWGANTVSGATVAVVGPESDSLSTGPTGLASFTAANSHDLWATNQSGDVPYSITASKSGYDNASVSGVALVPGVALTPNPVLYMVTTRTGTFNITTRKNSDSSLRANSVIRITGPSSSPDGIASTTMDFTSDASGIISINYLPLGTYTFKYKSGTNYNNVSSPGSKTLSNDGDSLTFDVKW